MRAEQKTQITLHIDPAIKEASQKAAAADRRSFNNYVENLLAVDAERNGYLQVSRGTAREVA
jgi:hypothetical protein